MGFSPTRPTILLVILLTAAAPVEGESIWVGDPPPAEPHFPCLHDPAGSLSFASYIDVDWSRPGGEPIVAVTPTGTVLVATHPGESHMYPDHTSPTGVSSTGGGINGQTHLWRSTDCGITWDYVDLPTFAGQGGAQGGVRGGGASVSDPDLVVDAEGRVWYSDINGATVNVAVSLNDGLSFFVVNLDPFAEVKPIVAALALQEVDPTAQFASITDRAWLAKHGDELYAKAHYASRHWIVAANVTPALQVPPLAVEFEIRADIAAHCRGDIVANPITGDLLVLCPHRDATTLARGSDGGRIWEYVDLPVGLASLQLQEVAVDAAGVIYVAGARDGLGPADLALAYSQDGGSTWMTIDLGRAQAFPSVTSLTWPWVNAGAPGSAAVTFLGTSDDPRSASARWRAYAFVVTHATSPGPVVTAAPVTNEIVHIGDLCISAICVTHNLKESGDRVYDSWCQSDPATCATYEGATDVLLHSLCELGADKLCADHLFFGTPSDTGDRRMGDFFETAIGPDGILHVVVAGTARAPGDWVAHALHTTMNAGPRLATGQEPAGFPTQG